MIISLFLNVFLGAKKQKKQKNKKKTKKRFFYLKITFRKIRLNDLKTLFNAQPRKFFIYANHFQFNF
jgi:hypothetical protein